MKETWGRTNNMGLQWKTDDKEPFSDEDETYTPIQTERSGGQTTTKENEDGNEKPAIGKQNGTHRPHRGKRNTNGKRKRRNHWNAEDEKTNGTQKPPMNQKRNHRKTEAERRDEKEPSQ